jgi:hypothetical protein
MGIRTGMRRSLAPLFFAVAMIVLTYPVLAGGPKAKGYVIARYSYVGSPSASGVASRLGITGSFRLSALSDRVALAYRSRHWLDFRHTKKHVLESPFQNRSILQTISLETNGLLGRGLVTRFGRLLPEMDYAGSPAIDGGVVEFDVGAFSVAGAVGRVVDLWNGKRQSSRMLAAEQVKYRTERFRAAAGFQSAAYSSLTQREASGGFNVRLKRPLWFEAYGAYDFEFRMMARAGLGLSWQATQGSLSIVASLWRNPFDQLYLVEKGRDLPYWGLHSEAVPSTYQDVRLSGAYRRDGWGVRGTVGTMAGARTGWTVGAYLATPSLLGLNANIGTRAMKSDFTEFYSVDGLVTYQIQHATLQVQSQLRNYRWLGATSSLRYTDGHSEVSVIYPLGNHIRVDAAVGGYFREFGRGGFKPEAELRLVARR